MRCKVFCLILGIAVLMNCSEQSIDENLPTAQNQDSFITEAVRDSNDVPVEIPPYNTSDNPPAYISVMLIPYPPNDSLSVEVRAIVSDEHYNPVGPGWAVHFAVIPDSLHLIEETVYTNDYGMAHTFLLLINAQPFDTIQLIAAAGTVADTIVFLLGLYDGWIDVYADPGFLFVQEPETYENSEVVAQLLDGLNRPVNNGIINFTVQVCGELSGPYADTTDNDGYANTEFRIWYEQIPHEPPELPNCTAIVVSSLQGYPDIEGTAEIYCARRE